MKKTLLAGFLGATALLGCRKNPAAETPQCKFVNNVTAPATCYTPAAGLTLTAEYAGTTPQAFEWGLYDQPDTVRGSFDLLKVIVKRPGTESFVVADSLLSRRSAVGVTVNVNCDGQILYSTGFVFVKRRNGTCTTWVRKL